MAKKHCEKHARYVYNCDACRLANNEVVKGKVESKKKPSRPKKTTKTKKSTKKKDDIPPVKIPIEKDIVDEDQYEDAYDDPDDNRKERYSYRKPPSRRKRITIIAGIIVATVIILIISLFVIPKWYGRISLNNQLYSSKTDISNTYWEFRVLNYWSTNFIINKTGLIGALIGCIIFSLPPERKIFNLLTNRFGWKKLKIWKVLLIWWTAGFVLFYLFGQLIDADVLNSQFSLVIYMAENGDLDLTGRFFSAFMMLRDPTQLDMVDVFVYTNLYRPIINFVLILIIVRIIISIVTDFFTNPNYFHIAAKGSFIIALFFMMNFFSFPSKGFDGLRLILVWTTPIGIIGFIALGIFFIVYSHQQGRTDEFTRVDMKRTIIAGISLVVLLLMPAFISVPTTVKINNDQTVWEEQRWNKKLAIEREWTIQAAGLEMFNNTQDITVLNETETGDIANSIRQYDKESALYLLNSYAQTSFEGIADSDIVYVNDKEYWVSPKTLKYDSFIRGDNIKEHTNQYDHVEGFLAIDPFTGDLISNETDVLSIFGVNNSYPIFFGEHEYIYEDDPVRDLLIEQTTQYGAFDDDILLNTNWTNTESYDYVYEGEKDGTLDGLAAFWFTLDMGLTSYAFDGDFQKDFLINRNIKTRVGNILLPGLEIDGDPYLVFDFENNRMYYALSIYTELHLGSYAKSDLLRYIGTVLVDVKLGTLDFVANPQFDTLNERMADPTYPLWKIYMDAYPWITVNASQYVNWLKEQLRYPEGLFETQLEYQYTYHVSDPNTWRAGSQFYDRPPSGDLFYVRFDLGEEDGVPGLEFVGIDLVQRRGVNATTLAGMYVLRHGVNFGEVRFYSGIEVGQTNMIGPNTAKNSLIAAATNDLVLIDNEDYGNVLLYPIGTSLYYFVPVYSTSTDNRFQVLKIAGFVNAFDALDVVYGESAEEAYELLNISIIEEFDSGNVTLTYEIDTTTLENDILIDMLIKSTSLNFEIPATSQNVRVNISIESDIVNVTLPWNDTLAYSEYNYTETDIGYNFTILDTDLYPSEGYSTTIRMSADLGSVYSSTVRFKIIMIVDGIVYEPDFYEYATFYK